MASVPTIRIFFSSPGDVKMERETARRIVERLQAEVGARAQLEPYFWEHEVMLATRDYQQNIPPMEGFDVVVCILWSRLGSPLNPERHPRPGGGYFASGTEYEFFMAMQAHKARGAPDVLVFRNRTEPRRPSRPKEAREAVDREIDRLDQFFETYFRTGEYYTAAVNSYRTLGEFEERLTQGLHAFLEQHLPAADTHARPVATYQGRPYLGLSAFDFDDAPVFFGRTAQVGEVVRAFQAQELEARSNDDEGRRFVLVLGASGSGKSSLARAGVLPMLVQSGVIEGAQVWRRAVLKPGSGGDSFLALAGALLAPEALPELGADGTNAAALAKLLRSQPGGAGMLLRQALIQAAAAARSAEELRQKERLRQFETDQREEDAAQVRERLARLAPPAVRLALLADQLEELFTTEQTSEQRAAFVECLASIAGNGRVFVLGTLRSDFYAECLAFPALVKLMQGSGTYALPAPGPAELGQMIRQPAAAAGLAFEEDSASGEKLDELLRDAALRDPGALPLLGYTLEQLYERRTPEGLLRLADYRELGGLEGAIGRRAEAVFAALPAEAQAAFDPVWRQLVTLGEGGSAVRRRAGLRALTASPGAAALVEALVAARLFTADRALGDEPVISVVHEALLGHWPRVKEWIEKNREFLGERARLDERLREWESRKHHKGCLIPAGPALEQAQAILQEHAAVLTAQEIDYIQRSLARAQALERRETLLQYGWRSLTVVALLAGAYAWHERGVAREERVKADGKRQEAEASAAEAHRRQVRASYLLGIEMLESGKTREGLTELVRTLVLDPEHAPARERLYSYHLYGPPKAIGLRSTIGPAQGRQQISTGQADGVQRVACLDGRGAAEVFDLGTQSVVPGDWSSDSNLTSAVLNRTGSHLVCQRAGSFRVWPIAGGAPGPWIESGDKSARLACSDDGTFLVEAGEQVDEQGNELGRVRLWDAVSGKPGDPWVQADSVVSLELDSSRGLLATAGGDVVFVDLAAGKGSRRAAEPGWQVHAVRFAENADVAVVEERAPTLEHPERERFVFVNARTGEDLPGVSPIELEQPVFDFALNRDGSALALAPFASNAELRLRDDSKTVLRYPHPTYPALVRFSPDQSQLLTASTDGTVRIFDAATTELVFEPIQHDGRLEELMQSWDSRFLLTSTNRTARIWDLAVARAVPLPLTQAGVPLACGFTADGTTIWTASSGTGLQAWDAQTLEPRGGPLEFRPLFGALLDDPCRLAVARLGDGTLRVIDLARGVAVGEPWRLPEWKQFDWALSGDATRVLAAVDATVTRLSTSTGRPEGGPWVLPRAPRQVRLGGNGRLAAAVEAGGSSVLLHDFDSGVDTRLETFGMDCLMARFSRDDHWLAVAAKEKGMDQFCVLLWDLHAPGAEPSRLPHDDEIRDLRFSPDSQWLATGTKGQVAQVWNPATREVASRPIFQTGNVVRIVLFSPDSKRLALSYGDRTVRVYDWLESCAVSEPLRVLENPVDLSFASDGTRLLALGNSPADVSKCIASAWEIAEPASLPRDLVIALTEAETALRVPDDAGVARACDPFDGWERMRRADRNLWFLEQPARRPVSPAFKASIRRWIVDEAIPPEQAYYAMPAVGMVRAALAFWRQGELNALRARPEPTEKAAVEERAARMRMLETAVNSLSDSARRCARGDAVTSLWLGLYCAISGQPDSARTYIEDALRLAPDDQEILGRASEAFRYLGDCDAELRTLQKRLAREPDSVEVRRLIGNNRWRCADTAAARAQFREIVDDPSNSLLERAQMLACLGLYDEALGVWDRVAKEQTEREGAPSDELRLLLAIGHQLAGQTDEAASAYAPLIQREAAYADPKNIPVLSPFPEFREALKRLLEATLERHPELRPK